MMYIQPISVIFLLQILTEATSMYDFDLNMIPAAEDEETVDQSDPSPFLPIRQSQNQGPQGQMIAGSVEPLDQGGLSVFPHSSQAISHPISTQLNVNPWPSKVSNKWAAPASGQQQQPREIGQITSANASNKGKQKLTGLSGDINKVEGEKATSHRYHPYRSVPSYTQNMHAPTIKGTGGEDETTAITGTIRNFLFPMPPLTIPVPKLPAALAAKKAGGDPHKSRIIEPGAKPTNLLIRSRNNGVTTKRLPTLTADEKNALVNVPHTFRGTNYIFDNINPDENSSIWKCSMQEKNCLSQLILFKEEENYQYFRRTGLHTCGLQDKNNDIIVGSVCIQKNDQQRKRGYYVKFICKDKEGFALTLWTKRMEKDDVSTVYVETNLQCTDYVFDMQYCQLADRQFYFHISSLPKDKNFFFPLNVADLIGRNILNVTKTKL